jgi:Protein of unknown function (DUF3828)
MSSTAVKKFCLIASAVLTISWACPASAEKAQAGTIVVAKLYKDFAWQAMASQAELFGEDLAHQRKATLEKYFAPTLARLLLEDAACQVKYQGICNLDFDLLFSSQDPRVSDLEIIMASPGKVSVAFKDPVDDKQTRIDFQVAQVGGAWKITDIVYRQPQELSLKKVLSRKLP